MSKWKLQQPALKIANDNTAKKMILLSGVSLYFFTVVFLAFYNTELRTPAAACKAHVKRLNKLLVFSFPRYHLVRQTTN